MCGGGGCLYFSNSHFFTLKLLLLFTVEQGCRSLQVFGDSLVIINWDIGVHGCHVSCLLPMLEDVLRIKILFDSISFSHIYRERNQLADGLSKEASQLTFRQWYNREHTSTGIHGFYHKPFHDRHYSWSFWHLCYFCGDNIIVHDGIHLVYLIYYLLVGGIPTILRT